MPNSWPTPLSSTPDSKPGRYSGRGDVGRAATTSVGSIASAPQFFIEYMGTSETWLECNLDPRYTGSDICLRPVYRVTARSEAAGRASVIVQSNFIVP
ncbi:pilus assembly protein [Xanthomonas phaseoli]|uniref:pilus assembly protein n=1 Tax=Xanthomonas phaseoli TaxID=1985254 RepID=UPI0012677D48|nr:pilus assembly protein [Xanthomonas phaseoli]